MPPKNPLFSTYRQGENRVTASMLAVFERIDIGIVERLLSAATGESALSFVSFANQIAAKERSIPDAAISANFHYLFEVKTERNALRQVQLEQHLDHLGNLFAQERLFVLTPDPEEPPVIAGLEDRRVSWLNFGGLDQAIDELLHDETELVAEQTRFLLHELRALFNQEGLVSHEDTVIVAAKLGYPMYLQTAAYVWNPGRVFRSGVKFMGFYYDGAIQPEIARIATALDVEFEEEAAETLEVEEQDRAKIAELIPRLLDSGFSVRGQSYRVFLLSPADDPDTSRLPHAIKSTATDRNGKPCPWVQRHRYTFRSALMQGPETTSELKKLAGS